MSHTDVQHKKFSNSLSCFWKGELHTQHSFATINDSIYALEISAQLLKFHQSFLSFSLKNTLPSNLPELTIHINSALCSVEL